MRTSLVLLEAAGDSVWRRGLTLPSGILSSPSPCAQLEIALEPELAGSSGARVHGHGHGSRRLGRSPRARFPAAVSQGLGFGLQVSCRPGRWPRCCSGRHSGIELVQSTLCSSSSSSSVSTSRPRSISYAYGFRAAGGTQVVSRFRIDRETSEVTRIGSLYVSDVLLDGR